MNDNYEAPSVTIKVDLEGLKRLVRDFELNLPNCDNLDQWDAGFKVVSLAYLGMDINTELEEIMAQSTFRYAQGVHLRGIEPILNKILDCV